MNFGYKEWLDIMLNSKNNCEDLKYKCKESKNHSVLELTLVESYYIRSIFLQISNNWLILIIFLKEKKFKVVIMLLPKTILI
jgi:hypothetical protein